MTRAHAHKITKTEIREKFVGEEYPIHVIGRNLEISDAMRSYALDKLVKLERFGMRILNVHIVMDVQRGIHMADFLISLNNTKILVSGRDRDMYAAIDQALTRLKTKMSRYHRELSEHNKAKMPRGTVSTESGIQPLDEINDQIEEETLHHIESELAPHPISKREKIELKLLSEEEAIWKMENNAESCLMFRSEEDDKIKVIYRQHDGNYGIIES